MPSDTVKERNKNRARFGITKRTNPPLFDILQQGPQTINKTKGKKKRIR